MFTSNSDSSGGIYRVVVQYLRLLLEDARLSAAEKMTRLFAGVALAAILLIFGTMIILFISFAVSMLLAEFISELGAFLLVAAFYVIALIIIILCRRVLIEDPIARFVSKLILTPEKPQNDNEQPTVL